MGDSGLTTYLAVAAVSAIMAAIVLAALAWRVRNRAFRIPIGLGLVVLGLACTVVSLAGLVLIVGLGVGVLVAGVRTRQQDGETHGAGN